MLNSEYIDDSIKESTVYNILLFYSYEYPNNKELNLSNISISEFEGNWDLFYMFAYTETLILDGKI